MDEKDVILEDRRTLEGVISGIVEKTVLIRVER